VQNHSIREHHDTSFFTSIVNPSPGHQQTALRKIFKYIVPKDVLLEKYVAQIKIIDEVLSMLFTSFAILSFLEDSFES
jgi:hypothetical protein